MTSLVDELLNEGRRNIDTGLTGPVNKATLDSVMGQLSDGKWENVPMMSKYWRHADIEEIDGKIFIVVDDGSYDSGFRGKDDKWIKSWFAGKIKEIVYDEMGGSQWSRGDRTELGYLSRSGQPITVRDAYQAYEILKGRNIKNRYAELAVESQGQFDQFIVMTVNGDMHNHYGPYEDEDEAEALAKRIHGQVYPLLEPSYSDEPEPAEDRWQKMRTKAKPAGIDY